MIEVLKNLAKLLAVAVLAGVLGALGGYLINSFTDKPQSPAVTTMPSLLPDRPESTAEEMTPMEEESRTREEQAALQEEKEEPAGSDSTSGPSAEKEAGTQPQETRPAQTTTTAPAPPPTTAAPAPQPEKPSPPEEKPEPKDTAEAEKPAPQPKPDKAAPEKKDQAPPEAEAPPATAPAPPKPSPPETQEGGPSQGQDKSTNFDEMVESQKDKVVLVKSVSASTVDQTVVIRVAMDRSAEPKFSRLVGKGKLRIILDFDNAVRIKDRVPDVIDSPSPEVTGIRIGAHPDKLRIVVDLDPKRTYSINQHLFSRAYVLEIKPQ